MTGQYTDFIFPQYGVRYIAVNDSVDTLNDDNDIAPFKNILNEMYAKDTSKKIIYGKKGQRETGQVHGQQSAFRIYQVD